MARISFEECVELDKFGGNDLEFNEPKDVLIVRANDNGSSFLDLLVSFVVGAHISSLLSLLKRRELLPCCFCQVRGDNN